MSVIHLLGCRVTLSVNPLPGQVRDEYRTDFDSGRGGYGKIVQQKLEVPNEFV